MENSSNVFGNMFIAYISEKLIHEADQAYPIPLPVGLSAFSSSPLSASMQRRRSSSPSIYCVSAMQTPSSSSSCCLVMRRHPSAKSPVPAVNSCFVVGPPLLCHRPATATANHQALYLACGGLSGAGGATARLREVRRRRPGKEATVEAKRGADFVFKWKF